MDTSQANFLLQMQLWTKLHVIFEQERLADLEPGTDIEGLLNQFVDVIIFYPIYEVSLTRSGSYFWFISSKYGI